MTTSLYTFIVMSKIVSPLLCISVSHGHVHLKRTELGPEGTFS
jgi:hypothetical protein